MSGISALIKQTIARVIPRSKERYYSSDKWNNSWAYGYDLNIAQEDARYGTLMALMRRYEEEGPLLDVGCGDGLLEERYRALSSVQIVAFDYSETAIERAKERRLSNVDFLCADSRTFCPKQQFSIIILNESLYYIDDYLGLMKHLSGTLKPHGAFIISMHDNPITQRIWKNVLRSYTLLQHVALKDECAGSLWRICLLRARK
jgi:trans-aconitate methyltransferase